MITLRIQEIADAKSKPLTLEELSQVSGVSLKVIQDYATKPIKTLTEEVADNLRKLADKLEVDVLELVMPVRQDVDVLEVKPVDKQEAVKLEIRKIAKDTKDWNLQELSKQCEVDLIIVEFYSKQPIYKQKLDETSAKETLSKICKALDCQIEDLLVEVKAEELPETKLRIEELAAERGLSLNDLSLLTRLSYEFIDLVATQPINVDLLSDLFTENEIVESADNKIPTDDNKIPPNVYVLRPRFCRHLGFWFPGICRRRF
ncbi:helix-turn-helix transcriptional regulator [Coleofasciculus sp. FACHB-129]|uniref:helix-turn-helix domain-containing protein n=1 Tax=Cyanophyceae TaxID=3028117 RepID=UPI00168751F5|nr:helix-turn-helix transcriptional regulator [Coleofasciculus sp. FACHB-129]MBD1894040.1 helix-turn-helix transcriptional regulator [Coleofasciculus sp. FACHB-129]